MDVSIIVVSYNTCELTLRALRSIEQSQTDFRVETIVVDNHSNDASVSTIQAQFPQVGLIRNAANLGFAKANNLGIRQAGGRYILLLNSDTVLQKDTLDVMLRFMDGHPRVGASGCKVVLPDGSLDKSCRRGFPTPSAAFYYAFGFSRLFPNRPRFNQYQLGHLDPDREYPVDCLVGAFMLVRREAVEQAGLLDEDFFMYGEDIDWCYRIKQAGWEIYYYPRTSIVHHKGASSRSMPLRIIYEFHRAMILFHRKHYRQKYTWFTNTLVYLGVGIKFIGSVIVHKLRLKGVKP